MVKIKNLQLSVIVAIMMMIGFISACDKKKNNNSSGSSTTVIEASNISIEQGSDASVTQVKIVAFDEIELEIASAPYQNRGFKITLPASVNNQYLETVADMFEGIEVSDPNAKCVAVPYVIAFNNNYPIGMFMLGEETNTQTISNTTYTCWIYVDKDVSVKGSATGSDNWSEPGKTHQDSYTESANIICKKGWNIIYTNEIEKETYNSATDIYIGEYQITYSNQKPSNNLKWHGYIFGSYSKNMPKDKIHSKFGKNLKLKNILK